MPLACPVLSGASAQPTAGRPKAGRQEAAGGACAAQEIGGFDGRRRLTGQSPTATAEPIDKGCTADARTPARHGTGRGARCSPRGWGETYTDAWTARSNAQGGGPGAPRRSRGSTGPARTGAGRHARLPPRAFAKTRGCKPSVYCERGKERGASCPKKILRRGRRAKHPPSEQGRRTGSRPTPKERRSCALSPTQRAGRRQPQGE